MGRKAIASAVDLAQRLMGVKVMVRDLEDALPTMARELRRNACETLDEVIGELARAAPKASGRRVEERGSGRDG